MKTNSVKNFSKSFKGQSIDLEINSIIKYLETSLAIEEKHNQISKRVVKKEELGKFSMGKAAVGVYDKETLEMNSKIRKETKPLAMYVFYADSGENKYLESVAIYGNNVAEMLPGLKTSRSLFGRKIRSAKMEMGRRPFIDVRFAPQR